MMRGDKGSKLSDQQMREKKSTTASLPQYVRGRARDARGGDGQRRVVPRPAHVAAHEQYGSEARPNFAHGYRRLY